MTHNLTLTLALGSVIALAPACGGTAPAPETPTAPSPSAGAVPPASPIAETPPAPVEAPAKPKQVNVDTIEIEGGGIEKADVEKALADVQDAYEKCYADALAAEPDAAGKLSVTFLFMKGERKSTSASYSGRGSQMINSCFQEASSKMTLKTSAEAERTVITIRLKLAKAE